MGVSPMGRALSSAAPHPTPAGAESLFNTIAVHLFTAAVPPGARRTGMPLA